MCGCRSPTAAISAAAIAWRERMAFAPRAELLSFDEIETLADLLIARGVRRLRLTGGEPLVRRGIGALAARLGARLGRGLEELTLTTNGTRLAGFARTLFEAGVRRVNVSLDSLVAERFRHITRHGDLGAVLGGIAAAAEAGLEVKINMVALKDLNEDEIEPMLRWCAARGHDLTLIETMPMGETGEDRARFYLPLDEVRRRLERSWALTPSLRRTGGPARYYEVGGTGIRLGLITPAQRQFLQRLQPHPGHRDRHRLWLPRPRPEGRAARCAARRRRGGRRGAARCPRRRQAPGPRLPDRRGGARGRAPYERHRRLSRPAWTARRCSGSPS